MAAREGNRHEPQNTKTVANITNIAPVILARE
jgi:hypothetical protein